MTRKGALIVGMLTLMGLPAAFATEPSRQWKPQPTGTDNMTVSPYTYDGAGNVKTIGRGTMGQEVYAYDVLGRLTSGTADVVHTQSYQYDPFGNRTVVTRSGVPCTGDSTCEQTGAYAPGTNHLSNNGADYDAAGNLIAYGAARYAYDAAGMLSRSVSSLDQQYLYTASDERIAVYDGAFNWRWTVRGEDGKVLREFKSTNNGTTLGVANRQWATDYVWRDGLLLATENRTPTS